MKKLICSVLLLFVVNTYAQIYVKQESNGDIVYSDVPMNNAKTVSLPQQKPQTISTEEVVKKTEKNDELLIAKDIYKTFRIISPIDQETIQNQPNINVSLQVDPELQKNDRIQLFIDGKPIGDPSASLRIDTGLVERGSHEMYALIVDQNKRQKMQSNVITIYVMRAHTGAPAIPPKAQPATKKVSLKSNKKLHIASQNNKKLNISLKYSKPRVSFKNDKKPKVYLARNH